MSTASQLEAIVRLARAPQAPRRQEALDRIAALPDAEARRSAILAVLAEPSHAARETALECIEHWRESDPALVDALLDQAEALASDTAPRPELEQVHRSGTLQAVVVGLRRLGLDREASSARDSAAPARLERLLAELSSHDDADVRYQARAARELRAESGADYVAELCRWLDDDDAEVRIIAAQGLTRLEAREAGIEPLQRALGRAGATDRIHLLLALATLRAPGLSAALLDEAQRGAFRFPALVALGDYGDAAVIPALLKLAGGWFGEPLHKVAAARAAAQLGAAEGRAALERFVGSRRPEVRGFALQAQAELGVEGTVERLRAAAREPRDPARLQAIELLGEHGEAGVDLALLEALAGEAEPELREVAREAAAALRARR